MTNKNITAWNKFDEDDKECRNCEHCYWCEDCNDLHCEIAIFGNKDAPCEYMPRNEE